MVHASGCRPSTELFAAQPQPGTPNGDLAVGGGVEWPLAAPRGCAPQGEGFALDPSIPPPGVASEAERKPGWLTPSSALHLLGRPREGALGAVDAPPAMGLRSASEMDSWGTSPTHGQSPPPPCRPQGAGSLRGATALCLPLGDLVDYRWWGGRWTGGIRRGEIHRWRAHQGPAFRPKVRREGRKEARRTGTQARTKQAKFDLSTV